MLGHQIFKLGEIRGWCTCFYAKKFVDVRVSVGQNVDGREKKNIIPWALNWAFVTACLYPVPMFSTKIVPNFFFSVWEWQRIFNHFAHFTSLYFTSTILNGTGQLFRRLLGLEELRRMSSGDLDLEYTYTHQSCETNSLWKTHMELPCGNPYGFSCLPAVVHSSEHIWHAAFVHLIVVTQKLIPATNASQS